MLELQEWHRWYKACVIARAEYRALMANREANADAIGAARERLDRAEAVRARIMSRLERSEAC